MLRLLQRIEEWLSGFPFLIQVASVAIAFFGLAFVAIQIRNARTSREREEERLRKFETFSLYNNYRDRLREDFLEIAKYFAIESFYVMSADDALQLRKSGEMRAKAYNLLSFLERTAVGAKAGVYDEDILFQISRSQIMSIWAFFEAYIWVVRENTPKAYRELEELVHQFEKLSYEKNLSIPVRFQKRRLGPTQHPTSPPEPNP